VSSIRFLRLATVQFHQQGILGLHPFLLLIARSRNILLIWIATILPISFCGIGKSMPSDDDFVSLLYRCHKRCEGEGWGSREGFT
jgi:hypothetical protein